MPIVETPKKLCQVSLGSSNGTLYTVPDNTSVIVKSILVQNYHTSNSATVTLFHSAFGSVNRLLPKATLAPGEWAWFDGVVLMEAASYLGGNASVSSTIAVTAYGVELTEV